MTFTHVYRPAPDEPEHSEPHFNALGLCVCSCGLCTLSLLGSCVCLDCPCDGEGDRGAEHVMVPDFPKPYISPLEFAAFTVEREPQEIPAAFRRKP